MLQIVLHGKSSHLRKQALRDNKLTLQQLLLLGRQDEMSRLQAADIEGKETENVHYFQKKKSMNTRNASQASSRKTCNNCGGEWPHQNGMCPAKGQTCRKCHKLNHFARKCRSKEKHPTRTPQTTDVRPLDVTENNSSDSEMENCYAIETKPKLSKPQINIRVNGHVINFLIDTGSSINVISKTIYDQKLKDIPFYKTSLKALPFTSTTPVPLKVKFQATLETKHQFHVATSGGSSLGHVGQCPPRKMYK